MNMRLMILAILVAFNLGWTSQTGSEVVSDDEVNIVRASLEATTVLQSDALALLYGEVRAGGASNYASFDSGGVLNFDLVNSSSDVVNVPNNSFIRWTKSTGVDDGVKFGLSQDDVFIFGTALNVSGDLSITDTDTGSSAGTDLCIGTDNKICQCNSCL